MLTLKYTASTTIPVEAEIITPDNLAGKSPLEIAKLKVQHGNREESLGDFFAIDGDASDGHLTLEGDCSRVKLVGAEMKSGRIDIRGPIGMHVGAEMRGGELHVHGNAGDWVGAEMRGGLLHVHGDAGHLVGAAYRGGRYGMLGGAILVDGKAGNEIGATMRRGLIAIGGDTGDFPGVGLIAGTVCVFGAPGIRVGANMKRGTIALFGPPAPLLPTFRFACVYRPVFMNLYLQQLRRWNFAAAHAVTAGRYRRYSGDLVALGKGEILAWERD
jgi:formylmethanofuran dehydrogenase subunit C